VNEIVQNKRPEGSVVVCLFFIDLNELIIPVTREEIPFPIATAILGDFLSLPFLESIVTCELK
jgi:hypothetical protein